VSLGASVALRFSLRDRSVSRSKTGSGAYPGTNCATPNFSACVIFNTRRIREST
jgi:hypothetical protein